VLIVLLLIISLGFTLGGLEIVTIFKIDPKANNYMVRDKRYRLIKWDKKIDPSIVLDRFSKLKETMKEQIDPYFSQVQAKEVLVKDLLEKKGVPSIQIAYYLAYTRELIGKTFGSITSETLRNEELAIRSKWVNRGLNDNYLKEIAKIFGINPKPLPTGELPFDIIKDFETEEELNDIETFIEPSDIPIIFERTDEWAKHGNYSLKFGAVIEYQPNPYTTGFRFPFNASKYKNLLFYFKALEDMGNVSIIVSLHNSITNEWYDISVSQGWETAGLIFGETRYVEVLKNQYEGWENVDKVAIKFVKRDEYAIRFAIDYFIAEKI
jgi:hypothetical protein